MPTLSAGNDVDWVLAYKTLPEPLQLKLKTTYENHKDDPRCFHHLLASKDFQAYARPYDVYLGIDYHEASLFAPLEDNCLASIDWRKLYEMFKARFLSLMLLNTDVQPEKIRFIELALLKDPDVLEHIITLLEQHAEVGAEVFDILASISLEAWTGILATRKFAACLTIVTRGLTLRRPTMNLILAMAALDSREGERKNISVWHVLARSAEIRGQLMTLIAAHHETLFAQPAVMKALAALPTAAAGSAQNKSAWWYLATDPRTRGQSLRAMESKAMASSPR